MKGYMQVYPTGYWDGTNPYHTMSKPVLDWLIDYLFIYKDTPIYDFGCGNGAYLAGMKEAGFTQLKGFEGDPPRNSRFDNIVQQDLTKPFIGRPKGTIISLEVAEHIPSEFTDTYLENVWWACDSLFICSWAIPGQGGLGHVNELSNADAIQTIMKHGFRYLEYETLSARSKISDVLDASRGLLPWFKNTLLVFEK